MSTFWRRALVGVALSLIPSLFLEGLRLVGGMAFSWSALIAGWIFCAAVVFAARLAQPSRFDGVYLIWPWPALLLGGVGALAALGYVLSGASGAAWVALAAVYALLLALDEALPHGHGALYRWGVRGLLALAAGVMPVAIAQVEAHFAEEEFFSALQALVLGAFWLLLLAVWRLLRRGAAAQPRRGLVQRRWFAAPLAALAVAGVGATLVTYQRSFYPPQAPPYPQISAAAPFLCGEAPPDPRTFDGEAVFRRLLARVEANPLKAAPDYGLLALGSGDRRWARTFHDQLLSEARQGLFSGPADSVKFIQYEAALHAYYYPRVRAAFPALFDPAEEQEIQQWFAAINRRALTVEWVDWMYASALAKWPEGPYENQENGAGLLALLEAEGLGAPDLSSLNRDYLARNPRGWQMRFRNTDDAFVYQPDWIHNALFQSLYTGVAPQEQVRRSFEWLLLQALPDGAAMRYNLPFAVSPAGAAYEGAALLNDPRYVWLAGKGLQSLEARGELLFHIPLLERPVGLLGRSPTQGSCLLYGDSGLPNQVGPLAPDKIVFRDGWSDDSMYLMLNLRFSGWHRYKATNTLTLLYQGGPLAGEALAGQPFAWLPVGRSLFRDKRIPREDLNGLLIERSGMSAVLYQLTGMGGPWAQDPPYYARVERFETGSQVDISTTVLEGWRGWRHSRTVYFYHHGPVVVVDAAQGPAGARAALTWHVAADGPAHGSRIRLRGGQRAAEMLLLPAEAGEIEIEETPGQPDDPSLQVVYNAPGNGRLEVVTLFLSGAWVGAQASIAQAPSGAALQIVQGVDRISLPLDRSYSDEQSH